MATILVIEDNLEILDNTTEMLELEGYNTLSAKNGIDGVEIALKHLPDLILCDIMMPEADGYYVLESIKANETTSKIPFIFLTASVERKEVEAAFDKGVNGYIRKPFDPDELYSTIKQLLS